MAKIDINERIEDWLPYRNAARQYPEYADRYKEEIKQLITDVLNEVVPKEKLSYSIPVGMPELLISRYQGFDYAVKDMDTKRKELGI